MYLARHLIVLISAMAFVLSTLTWWGHHAIGDSAHNESSLTIEVAASEFHGHSHGSMLDGKSAHKHDTERNASDPATASCCVATCAAAMPAQEPDPIRAEPLEKIRLAAAPEQLHEAAIAREDRPPRAATTRSGPVGPVHA